MLISDVSIKRPIFAAVMMLILLTLGLFSLKRLPIDMFPSVEMPVISIVTVYPGASPETVEREVSKRIEEAVNPISGVKHVTSMSREGVSTVIVEFQLEIKINEASQEARAKINAVRGDLPVDIEEPIIQKLDFSAMPIVSLAVRSDVMSPRELTTLVEKRVKRRIESLYGVGKVDLVGSLKREVNVLIDSTRVEALGMGVNEIIGGLQSENVNTPLGRLRRGTEEVPLRISGKPDFVEQFRTMVIAQRLGRPIYVSDVAELRDGIEEQRTLALVNGAPAVALDVMKQTGSNTVEVVDSVKREIERLKQDLPPDVRIELVRDGSVEIRDSVHDVTMTMLIGGLLTILIVFCFLNSWRSTVITGLTLPISVISSFIVMNFMGMSLNVMTLMALSLSIGLLIDDAIVVRENIVRHLERGQSHFTAAREGTNEIGLAVMTTAFVVMSVFIPVAFMKGIVGRFFSSFGITVAFAVLVSLFVSFTLDPMLSSRWFDPDIARQGKRNFLSRWLDAFNRWFDLQADRYRYLIGWSLDHRKFMLGIVAVAFFVGIAAFGSLEKSFIPEQDLAEFQINFQTAPDASIEESEGRVGAVLAMLGKVPEVRQTYASIGAGDAGTVRDAKVYVKLSDKGERARSQQEVQRDVRKRLREIPGIIPAIIEVGRPTGEKPLNVSIRGEDVTLLKKYAVQLKDAMYGIPGVVDIEVPLELDIPEYKMIVDRERAVNAGVTTGDIARTVGVLIGGKAVSTYEDEEGDAVDVRLRMAASQRQDLAQVENIRLAVFQKNGEKILVPLSSLVEHKISTTPSEIDRRDLTRQVVLSANLDRLALGTAVERIKEAAAKIEMLPGYRVIFSGEAEDMRESFGYMAEALLMAIIFVYLVLAALFESFIDPLAIMVSLPLAIFGMAGMLHLTGDTINLMSLIGLIMLMGLVSKNAILLVSFAKDRLREGMDRREALIAAGRIRLRPIMMTTLAMIFGMLPVALGIGKGAEIRAPMGRAVIGGLLTSTILTLLVIPVVYTLFDDIGNWIKKKWHGKEITHE
jgi:HAE1 family hydrophobic/amphiphilic exporter-1